MMKAVLIDRVCHPAFLSLRDYCILQMKKKTVICQIQLIKLFSKTNILGFYDDFFCKILKY